MIQKRCDTVSSEHGLTHKNFEALYAKAPSGQKSPFRGEKHKSLSDLSTAFHDYPIKSVLAFFPAGFHSVVGSESACNHFLRRARRKRLQTLPDPAPEGPKRETARA